MANFHPTNQSRLFDKNILQKPEKNVYNAHIHSGSEKNMDIQAILFDKDGTLMKFDGYWVEVSRHAINDILRQIGREDIPTERLLAALGVKDGISDTDGLLCKGTYEQIGLALNAVLREYGADVSEADSIQMTLAAYDKNADTGKVEPSATTSERFC